MSSCSLSANRVQMHYKFTVVQTRFSLFHAIVLLSRSSAMIPLLSLLLMISPPTLSGIIPPPRYFWVFSSHLFLMVSTWPSKEFSADVCIQTQSGLQQLARRVCWMQVIKKQLFLWFTCFITIGALSFSFVVYVTWPQLCLSVVENQMKLLGVTILQRRLLFVFYDDLQGIITVFVIRVLWLCGKQYTSVSS